MIEDFPTCYRILELEPGATLEEVKRSYRDLVKVWHPDRFPNDPKLQKKGEEKLKQINLAYDRICKGNFERSRESSPPAATSAQQPGKNAHASSGTGTSNNQSSSPREEPPRSQRSNPSSTAPAEQNGGRRFIQIAAAVAVIFIVKAIFFADGDLSKQTRGYSPHPTTQPPVLLEAFVPANPAQRLKPDGNPGLALSAVPPSARTPILEMVESPSIGVAGGSNTVAPAKTPEQPSAKFNRSIAGYFSVGSTKDEVLAVQGTPSRFTDTTFSYGSSDIIFGNGKVVSWTQYSMNPLRAKLLPTTRVGAIEYFTVGSTKDEVIAAQGTPSKFTDTTFSYGSSDVIFGNGKVVSWTQYSMNPLKAKLLPTTRVEPQLPVKPEGNLPLSKLGATSSRILYPWKTYVKFTIFGIGELPTDRPPLNQISSWDQNWKNNYGGFDDPNPANRIANRTAGEFRPKAFVPKLNSFYVALPYNDLETNGKQKAEASRVIPWFVRFPPESGKSACKSVWLQIFCNGRSCYAQWEAHGPSVTDDWDFVFGTKPPKTSQSGSAGIGVSPAIRDYLSLKSGDKVHWRFLETTQVPAGPWGKYGHN